MQTLLGRGFWVVKSAAIAVGAICAAHAVATQISAATWARGQAIALPTIRRPHIETHRAPTIGAIVGRNIFCATCARLPAVIPWRQDGPTDGGARATGLPLRLLAIMYARPPAAARWSIAIIRDEEARTTEPRALGSPVRGATIDEISQTRVYLAFGGGRREFIDLLPPLPPVATGRSAPVAASAARAVVTPLHDGIRRLGEHQYEVQRSTLQAWLGDLRQLASEVRILPELRDGRGAGIRLLGMRPEGPLAAIGLRNGDVLVAVNGLEITSPDKAIEVYVKLRSASYISVALQRDGRRINQELVIR